MPDFGNTLLETIPENSRRVVAPGMPGMASQDPSQAFPESTEQPIFTDGFDQVSTTSRLESACRTEQRADRQLVEADQSDQEKDAALLDRPTDRVDHVGAFVVRRPSLRATERARLGSDRRACSKVRAGP